MFVFQIRGKKRLFGLARLHSQQKPSFLCSLKRYVNEYINEKVYLKTFLLSSEFRRKNQSVVHLVRKSNLHGNSLLFTDLNPQIGIHWGEISLHGLYEHHGFFLTTFGRKWLKIWKTLIESCEFITKFKCFEYYKSYFIRQTIVIDHSE